MYDVKYRKGTGTEPNFHTAAVERMDILVT